MKVTLRSDNHPDVGIDAAEYVDLAKLDQHIRTLQVARKWLAAEIKNKTKLPGPK